MIELHLIRICTLPNQTIITVEKRTLLLHRHRRIDYIGLLTYLLYRLDVLLSFFQNHVISRLGIQIEGLGERESQKPTRNLLLQ